MATIKKQKRTPKPKAEPKRRGTRGPAPSVMTDEACEKLLTFIGLGMHVDQAARLAKVNPSSARTHRARHPDFADAIAQAEAKFEMSLIATILRAAQKGEWTASAWLAERRFPQRWSKPEVQQQINITNVDAQELAKAITEGLSVIARRHANFDEPDTDATEAAALGGVPDVELEHAVSGERKTFSPDTAAHMRRHGWRDPVQPTTT